MTYTSIGPLFYTTPPAYKLIVEVNPGIAEFYRSLVPKSVGLKIPMYPPHISVVRKEMPMRVENWDKHYGEIVEFEYETDIHHDETYYWLNAYSKRLEDIREELGLPVHSNYTRPPDGRRCFHITIGNLKNAP